MRLLVTGANGFLGSQIVRQAIEAGMAVRATDKGMAPLVPVEHYCRADILDSSSLTPALNEVDVVIHAAGLAHVFDKPQAGTAPFRAVNEIGTANVAQAAAFSGVKHFVLVSSVSVYGPFTRGAYDETVPCHPEGPYAQSKYQAERRAIEIAETSGMRLTILRLATLYGEGDPGNVARLMRTIDRGRFIWVGDGSNRKSLLYRGDAARACLTVTHGPSEGIRTYNVSAPPCTMREVVEGLAHALGRHLPHWRVPAPLVLRLAQVAAQFTWGRGRLGSLHATTQKWLADDVYDAGKFHRTFDFQTQVALAEGLCREAAWYRDRTR